MGEKFSWGGIRAPVQFLIRLARLAHFEHRLDSDIQQDLLRFILSYTYTYRHDDIRSYIQTPYDGPTGPMQTDKKYFDFWDQTLRPNFEPVFDVFSSCATQTSMTTFIQSFEKDEQKKVSKSLVKSM